jgi:hypothetical protein
MSTSRLTWLVILGSALTLALAPSAGARTLGPGDAEAAARTAVAAHGIEAVRCFPAATRPSGTSRRRAVCLIAHPAAEGAICRSLVQVRAPRGRAPLRVRVVRGPVCLPEPQFDI